MLEARYICPRYRRVEWILWSAVLISGRNAFLVLMFPHFEMERHVLGTGAKASGQWTRGQQVYCMCIGVFCRHERTSVFPPSGVLMDSVFIAMCFGFIQRPSALSSKTRLHAGRNRVATHKQARRCMVRCPEEMAGFWFSGMESLHDFFIDQEDLWTPRRRRVEVQSRKSGSGAKAHSQTRRRPIGSVSNP